MDTFSLSRSSIVAADQLVSYSGIKWCDVLGRDAGLDISGCSASLFKEGDSLSFSNTMFVRGALIGLTAVYTNALHGFLRAFEVLHQFSLFVYIFS
jgi:hypothetical protein